jgi:hypothetical protein
LPTLPSLSVTHNIAGTVICIKQGRIDSEFTLAQFEKDPICRTFRAQRARVCTPDLKGMALLGRDRPPGCPDSSAAWDPPLPFFV